MRHAAHLRWFLHCTCPGAWDNRRDLLEPFCGRPDSGERPRIHCGEVVPGRQPARDPPVVLRPTVGVAFAVVAFAVVAFAVVAFAVVAFAVVIAGVAFAVVIAGVAFAVVAFAFAVVAFAVAFVIAGVAFAVATVSVIFAGDVLR